MGSITIVGTGWAAGQLTLEAAEALRGADRIILHTRRAGCAEWLERQGLSYESLDALYDASEDFDEHIAAAAQAVLTAAGTADVVYGVSDVRDRTAVEILKRAGERARVIAGPPVEGALFARLDGEARCVEASDWENFHLSAYENCLVRELDTPELAAEVKLRLMDVYPEETVIWVVQAEGAPIQACLYELDRLDRYDHRTCALIPRQSEITALERYDFTHLNEIIRRLCEPDGCPWDRVQTHESLRTCLLEEAYEAIDAIDGQDPAHLYDELGDVLMQVSLHAEIGRRHGEFDISDVTTAICEKLIQRHTHIFGSDVCEDADEVLKLWARNKMAERGQTTYAQVMKSVTKALPAMLRAVKVLKRSAEAGLESADASASLRACADGLDRLSGGADAEAALGEALFALADVARRLGVDPEIALNGAINRFIRRFEAVENRTRSEGSKLDTLPPETLRKYWDLVKL